MNGKRLQASASDFNLLIQPQTNPSLSGVFIFQTPCSSKMYEEHPTFVFTLLCLFFSFRAPIKNHGEPNRTQARLSRFSTQLWQAKKKFKLRIHYSTYSLAQSAQPLQRRFSGLISLQPKRPLSYLMLKDAIFHPNSRRSR